MINDFKKAKDIKKLFLKTGIDRKVFFITPDEDGTLIKRHPAKKGRAIVEVDTDGSYVMSEKEIEESKKLKISVIF